jgi:phosphate transport system protein
MTPPALPGLRELRERLLLMAGRVEDMLAHATEALVQRDPDLARATLEDDRRVDQDEREADELCGRLLATGPLSAAELRFVTLALKMTTDLERLGDLAVNICERVVDLSARPLLKPYLDIPQMAILVQGMIREAVDAFVERDEARARAVIARDAEVDRLYKLVFRDVLRLMESDPAKVEPGIHVQSVAKALERMGDHGVNLAEQVVNLVAGRDIRHTGHQAE